MGSNHSLYPIREVSSLTGVNPVTLRSWQRRYGLVNPERSDKGHRLYSEQDLRTIRQIMIMLEKGIAIRHVKTMLTENSEGQKNVECELPQATTIYDALLARDLNRALLALDEAIKTHPIEVVHARLFTVIEQWLSDPPIAGSELVKALWHHCLYHSVQSRMQSREREGGNTLYLVLIDGALAHLGWWHALMLSQQGWRVIVLEGMREQLDTLASLLSSEQALAIYSDSRLSAVQLHRLRQLTTEIGCDLMFYGVNASLNQAAVQEVT